jgi:hypothetical protein
LYALITLLGAFSIIRAVKRNKNYDPILVGITVLWVGYQAQSIISINQIGLAVWGWLINGLAISYQMTTKGKALEKSGNESRFKKNTQKKQEAFSPQLIASLGAVIGLLLAVPPLSADAKWRQVQLSGKVEKVEPALSGGYMSPINSYRLAEAVQLLENSQLPEYAITYARKGAEFNSNYFDAWRMLYYATKSTPGEKVAAKSNMIRLDPLNKEWKNLP